MARAGDILSSDPSGDDQQQTTSKNCRWLSGGSAPLCVCTFKGDILLTNLKTLVKLNNTFQSPLQLFYYKPYIYNFLKFCFKKYFKEVAVCDLNSELFFLKVVNA